MTLAREGWRLYDAEPNRSVYGKLDYDHALHGQKRKPFWFIRDDVFCRIGCADHYTLKRPAGFPLPLSIRYSVVPPDQPYTLTSLEVLARHGILTVRQAAYCLNIPERQMYDYITEGEPAKLKDTPVRVRVDEMKALRKDSDE